MVLQQMGYSDVQMEKQIRGGMLQCDLYIGDIDMLIDIHGPCHYLNKTKVPIDSTLYIEKIYRKYHKRFIAISYEHLSLDNLKKFLEYNEESIAAGVATMREIIDKEMAK